MAVQPPAECLRSLVRVGRPRADGLGCDGSSLSERAGQIVPKFSTNKNQTVFPAAMVNKFHKQTRAETMPM